MLAVGCQQSGETRIFVHHLRTFLRVSERDHQNGALDAIPLRLSDYGIAPGDSLRIERIGEFQYNATHPDLVYYGLLVVFSATNELLPWTEPHRVPGAIAAGTPHVTRPTWFDKHPTDIPEDLVVGTMPSGDPTVPFDQPVFVRVPQGAQFMFLSPDDDHFADNLDDDQDFSLCINIVGRAGRGEP